MAYRRPASRLSRVLPMAFVLVTSTLTVPPAIAEPTVLSGSPMTLFSPGYQPVAATRVLDTLAGLGVTKAQLAAGSTTSVKVTGTAEVAGAGVAAVVVHVTASLPAASTALTLWETGTPRPIAPTLAVTKSTDTPNETYAVVRPDASGGISLYNSTAKTDVALDIVGWFPVGSPIETVPTTRIVDSQTGLGVRNVALGVGETTAFTALGRGGVPLSGVGSLMLLVTAVNPSAATSLTVYPNGTTRPAVASLLAPRRLVSSNLVLVPPATDGTVRIHNLAGSTHVTVDVVAWLSASDATRYRPITPTRVATARRVALAATSTVDITAGGLVPSSGVGAVVLGITALPLTLPRKGYPTITAWAAGATRPAAPSITVRSLKSRLMTVVVEPGTGGVSLYAAGAGFDVSVDVLGWLPVRSSDVTVTPGSVIADAGDVVAVDATSGGGGTVRVAAGLPVPSVGGHYGVMPQSLAPDGVLGTVTAVQAHSDGSKTLVLGPATLTDVFSDFRYAYSGPLGSPAQMSMTSGSPVVAAASPSVQAASCGTSVGLGSPTIDVSLGGGEFVLEYGIHGRHLKVLVNGVVTAGWAGSLDLGFSCEIEFPKVLVPAPPFAFEIGPVISVGVNTQGTVAWSASASVPFTAGAEYVDGELFNLSDAAIDASGDMEGSVAATLTVAGSLEAQVKLFGLAGGGISAGLELAGAIQPTTLPCAKISASFVLGFPISIGMYGLDWQINVATIRSAPATFYRKIDGCPIPVFARLLIQAEDRFYREWSGYTLTGQRFWGNFVRSDVWFDGDVASTHLDVVRYERQVTNVDGTYCGTAIVRDYVDGTGGGHVLLVEERVDPNRPDSAWLPWSLSSAGEWLVMHFVGDPTGGSYAYRETFADCVGPSGGPYYWVPREFSGGSNYYTAPEDSYAVPVATTGDLVHADDGTTFAWEWISPRRSCSSSYSCVEWEERRMTVVVGALE